MSATKRTPRGFAIYGEYKDSRGNTVRIQESSGAGGPYVWIFANQPDGESAIIHMGKPQSISPHLTRAQARRVAKALIKFADGEVTAMRGRSSSKPPAAPSPASEDSQKPRP